MQAFEELEHDQFGYPTSQARNAPLAAPGREMLPPDPVKILLHADIRPAPETACSRCRR
jgi:hypothetical protein